MPGLRYHEAPGAAAAAITRAAAASTFHSGMHLPATAGGLSWEYLADLRSVQQMMSIGAEESSLPFVSHRHTAAARPPYQQQQQQHHQQQQQQLPATWMSSASSRGGGSRDLGPQSTKQLLLNNGSGMVVTTTNSSSSCCIGSSESDDLAAMVHDFIENDSGDLIDHSCCDSDCGPPSIKLCENLQALTAAHGHVERELLADVKMVVLNIDEDTDLICNPEGGKECKGGCTKRFVVKHLKALGYNSAVCKSRWPSSGRVPGGEYEYIDVVFDGEESEDDEESSTDRYILDLDFQAQFEIARPTQQYEAALKSLPTIFVGTSLKLKQVLEIMSNAAKISLKQNAMHLPPWRTLDYMNAKWFSNFERKSSNDLLVSVPFKGPCSGGGGGGGGGSRHRLRWRDNNNHHRFAVVPLETKLCGEQLRRTKVSLLAEVKGAALSNLLPRSSSSSSRRRSSSQANLMLKEKHFVIEASSIRTKIF